MKKYYIFLSIAGAILIGFTVLAIFYYHDYYTITKEIYKLELNHTFTSLIPFFSTDESDKPKERPDTSGLQKEADVSLTLGIIFTVLACLALVLFTLCLIKMLKKKNQGSLKEATSSNENTGAEQSL